MTLDIVIMGLSITSSWGNGHAVTYRALVKALRDRGHQVTFLERDVPWYRAHRDLPYASYCRIGLYQSPQELSFWFGRMVRHADLVILGSYVPDGAAIGDWVTTHARGVTAFYDIDTPVTLAGIESGQTTYITRTLIPRFDLYLSFTGGPILRKIEDQFGSPRARVLHCAADLCRNVPSPGENTWTVGYLGTYSPDRQLGLERFLLGPARHLPSQRFIVAGSQYPAAIDWPANVARVDHVAPQQHAEFYTRQRFTLNVTRAAMRAIGFSPSIRLFEAAACGVPVISDPWPGLGSFFVPDREILVVRRTDEVLRLVREMPEDQRLNIGRAARRRLMSDHMPSHRAIQLENYYREVIEGASRGGGRNAGVAASASVLRT